MRDYPAEIKLCNGSVIVANIRSGSLCAAMHKVELEYGYLGIDDYIVWPAPLS